MYYKNIFKKFDNLKMSAEPWSNYIFLDLSINVR